MKVIALVGVSAVLIANAVASGARTTSKRTDFVRFEMETPGGPLPFVLHYSGLMNVSTPPSAPWSIVNGDEKIAVVSVANWRDEDPEAETYRDVIGFPEFGATIWWSIENERGKAEYRKFRGDTTATIQMVTRYVENAHDRFDREHPLDPDAIATIDGRWKVQFDSSDDPALGLFEVTGDGLATGTFLTTTGDYRFLEGVVDGRTLKLSCFDGGHAFLFHATLDDEGNLSGDFWSGNWWHETWTATPAPEGFELPDAFELTEWTGDAGLEDLVFKDLDGNDTSVAQLIEEAGGLPAVIEVFGSWCPNCHDAAEAVKKLKEKHDITVVALAFELTEDHERSVRQVRAFQAKHGAEWPVLIAGTAGKDGASEKLPVFDRLRAYPTTVFVREDGAVASVHTGFTGPAAPDEHAELLERWDAIVRGMVEGR